MDMICLISHFVKKGVNISSGRYFVIDFVSGVGVFLFNLFWQKRRYAQREGQKNAS
ncbi:hypothetical protein A464_1493 [Salmonella bongori N268-08]|uniref:Uncharacterized protein n=1 Tax=Salmonella bongori N268-08 TaxID=1197719 RepID=S5MVQ0_SALBN|nr:hypothetical protein A464_1493 [Salmonella bongori N268-08]